MSNQPITVTKRPFGVAPDGRVDCFLISNQSGMEVEILTYGSIVKSIRVPDKIGKLEDVTLGFDTLEGYLGEHPFFGAIIGRYGNRIAKGQFTLNQTTYQLSINDDPNTLHGGNKGFDKVLWKATTIPNGVALQYISSHLEEGFPGQLTVRVSYTLNTENALTIHYEAVTDQPTVCNLTNHTYFNLAGKGNVLNHQLQLDAALITPVDSNLIPTGRFRKVEGTAFDFRRMKAIGQDIQEAADDQLQLAKGYDHNFVLNEKSGSLARFAKVVEPASGRIMEVWTTEPGVQLYTANTFDGIIGKKGVAYHAFCAFCLETQHYPDAPNQANFPSTVLLPNQEYTSTTVYKFSFTK